MIAILGGLGDQARAIIHYILNTTELNILTFDLREHDVCIKYNHRWKHYCMSSLDRCFNTMDLNDEDNGVTVINCLPTEYILEATRYAIAYRYDIVDLGGVASVEREQLELDQRAMDTGSIVITASGLAPGIIFSFVSKFAEEFGELSDIKVYCCGIPKYPELPLGYVRSFNSSGIIKEYTGTAEIISDGSICSVPTLSDRELIYVPSLGVLEADITSGAFPDALKDINVNHVVYKTVRWPGHFDYVKNNILNQPNPVRVIQKVTDPVSIHNPDIIMLRFDIDTGLVKNSFTYFWEYDYENELSAMSRATGYVAAETALMIHDTFGSGGSGIFSMNMFEPNDIVGKIREFDSSSFSTAPIKY